MGWLKVLVKHAKGNLRIKSLTRKQVKIGIVVIFIKMDRDVGRFNKLNNRISQETIIPKSCNFGRSIRHHINSLYQFLDKGGNDLFGSDLMGLTMTGVQNQMISPGTRIFTRLSHLLPFHKK